MSESANMILGIRSMHKCNLSANTFFSLNEPVARFIPTDVALLSPSLVKHFSIQYILCAWLPEMSQNLKKAGSVVVTVSAKKREIVSEKNVLRETFLL